MRCSRKYALTCASLCQGVTLSRHSRPSLLAARWQSNALSVLLAARCRKQDADLVSDGCRTALTYPPDHRHRTAGQQNFEPLISAPGDARITWRSNTHRLSEGAFCDPQDGDCHCNFAELRSVVGFQRYLLHRSGSPDGQSFRWSRGAGLALVRYAVYESNPCSLVLLAKLNRKRAPTKQVEARYFKLSCPCLYASMIARPTALMSDREGT